MADEFSFDIVSEVDTQEVLNSVTQAQKELSQRYDFKGSKSSIEYSKEQGTITLVSDDDQKIKSVIDVLQGKLIKRKVPLKALSYSKVEPASGGTVKQTVTMQQGIPQDKAKDIQKLIKGLKLKVQSQIQDDQLRVKGKKKDDLQAVMTAIKDKDFGIHIDFVNYR